MHAPCMSIVRFNTLAMLMYFPRPGPTDIPSYVDAHVAGGSRICWVRGSA
jgi:hypothetical protein